MKSIKSRLEKLEKRLNIKKEIFLITIYDKKYMDIFTEDYLNEHYPGYKEYRKIYIPARISNEEDRDQANPSEAREKYIIETY